MPAPTLASMGSTITFFGRHARTIRYAAGAFGVLGMIGYVGGRMVAPIDPGLVTVVYFSTYVVLTGLALFGLVLVAISPIARRPFLLRAFAAVLVSFGVLMALFPYSRLVAYPEGVLAAVAILLLVAGWKDLCDPKVWTSVTMIQPLVRDPILSRSDQDNI